MLSHPKTLRKPMWLSKDKTLLFVFIIVFITIPDARDESKWASASLQLITAALQTRPALDRTDR